MTARKTSTAAFEALKASGALRGMKLAVYELLFEHGPLTGQEVDARLATGATRQPNYAKRLSELETVGLVERGALRLTPSGNQALTWDVTDRAAPLQPSDARTHMDVWANETPQPRFRAPAPRLEPLPPTAPRGIRRL